MDKPKLFRSEGEPDDDQIKRAYESELALNNISQQEFDFLSWEMDNAQHLEYSMFLVWRKQRILKYYKLGRGQNKWDHFDIRSLLGYLEKFYLEG